MPISTPAQPPLVRSLIRSLTRLQHVGEAHFGRPVEPARAVRAGRLGGDELDRDASAERASPRLGALLREAREASGRSIERIGAGLRIRPAYLRAIEAGAYEALPAPAYAIGFIRTYADYLGLDGTDMVRRFKLETEGQHLTPEFIMPLPLRERRISGGGILLGLALLGVCGYALHFFSSGREGPPDRVAPVPAALLAPPVASTSSPAPTPAQTAASMPVIPPPPARAPAAVSSPSVAPVSPLEARAASAPASAGSVDPAHVYGVSGDGRSRIALRATAETWLEVKDGETSIFRRLMESGDEYRLPDKAGLVMRVGNAHGIEVLVDGKSLPTAAPRSQAHRLVVNLEARELLARAATQ